MTFSIQNPRLRPDITSRPLMSKLSTSPSGNPWRIMYSGKGGGSIFPGGFFFIDIFPTESETTLEINSLSFDMDWELETDWSYIYIEAWGQSFTDPYYLETDYSSGDDPNGIGAGLAFGANAATWTGITGRSNGFVTVTVNPASLAAAEAALGEPVAYFDFIVDDGPGASWQVIDVDSITMNGVTDDFAGGVMTDFGVTGQATLTDYDETDKIGLHDSVFSDTGVFDAFREFHIGYPFRFRWSVDAEGHGGTLTASGTTSATVSAPAGLASGDLEFIFCESSDSTTAAGTPNTPSGWHKLFEETQGSGSSGVTTLTIFTRLNAGSTAGVLVDGVGDHVALARTYWSGHSVGDVTTDIDVGTGNGGNTGNPVCTALTTTANNSIVVAVASITRDAAATTNSASVTNATLGNFDTKGKWDEVADFTTSSGAGGGIVAWESQLVTAGTTGNTTISVTTSAQWRSVHLAFDAHIDKTWKMQYRSPAGSGSWTDIDASSAVQYTSSGVYNDGDVTTDPLFFTISGGERYLPGLAEEGGNSISFTHIVARATEFEFCMQFDAGLSPGDTVGVRLSDGGSVNSAETKLRVAAGAGNRVQNGWTWGRYPGYDIDYAAGSNYGCSGTWNDKLWFCIQTGFGSSPGDEFNFIMASYDPDTDRWEEVGTRQKQINSGQRAVYNGKMYFFNYFDENGDPQDEVQIYDINSDTWTTGPTIPAVANRLTADDLREDGTAIAVNGKIYLIGGICSLTTGLETVREVHIYDITGNSFDANGEDIDVGTTYDPDQDDLEFCHAAHLDGKIYVAGPKFSNGINPTSTVAVYDISGDSWEELFPSLPDDTYEWESAAIMTNPTDSTLWIIALDQYDPDANDPQTHVIVYDPSGDTWTSPHLWPTSKTISQWEQDTQEGWDNRFWSAVTRPVLDAQSVRHTGPNSVGIFNVAHGTTSTKMVMTDWFDEPRWYVFGAAARERAHWGMLMAP